MRLCFAGGTAHSALPALAKVARPKGLWDALLPKDDCKGRPPSCPAGLRAIVYSLCSERRAETILGSQVRPVTVGSPPRALLS